MQFKIACKHLIAQTKTLGHCTTDVMQHPRANRRTKPPYMKPNVKLNKTKNQS
nr:MAG TPA: hypothetical protein [Caudoviricetes sp.]